MFVYVFAYVFGCVFAQCVRVFATATNGNLSHLDYLYISVRYVILKGKFSLRLWMLFDLARL